MFGVTRGAKITKLTVTGKIKNVDSYGGGIVGHAYDKTSLAYCVSKVQVSGVHQIGGIVGRVSDSVMTYCINYKKVTATGRASGGITADLYPSGTLKYCLNYANVTGGYDLTGGITGGSTSGLVAGCVNLGNVVSDGGRIGAIAGDNASYAGSRVNNHFLKTDKINANLSVVGSNCSTITSKTHKSVKKILNKVKKKNS